ncbi:MAG: antitoxin [Lachnospiraceae bacterium]|nr:antitoxin [Lachnospiraceae bacterium]
MAKIMMNSLPAQLTPEEVAELEAAEKMPITFDEDCPEMTDDMLRQFHRMDRVTVRISPGNMKKVKSFGSDYAKVLSHLLDLALNDAEMIKKCL